MDSWSSGSSFIISVMWSSSMMWWWWCLVILYVYYVWTELADMITAVLLTSVTAGSLFGGTTHIFTLFIILYLSFHSQFHRLSLFFSLLIVSIICRHVFPAVIVIIVEFAAFAAHTVILLQIICARRAGEFFSLTQSKFWPEDSWPSTEPSFFFFSPILSPMEFLVPCYFHLCLA